MWVQFFGTTIKDKITNLVFYVCKIKLFNFIFIQNIEINCDWSVTLFWPNETPKTHVGQFNNVEPKFKNLFFQNFANTPRNNYLEIF